MSSFRRLTLFTAPDGYARWRDDEIALGEGTLQARLSALLPACGLQWRESPVGFRSDWHCTTTPQWLIVLRGGIEIGLRDGSTRRFGPGDCFFSDDTLPAGARFDAALHGHWSRQVGDGPLVTAFVRVG